MIVRFPQCVAVGVRVLSRWERPSSTPRHSCQMNLGSKMQRLALTHPAKLRVLEEVVDRWLDDSDTP